MIRNYLKIALRNLWKNKLFSFINIMGLGLAIPFALLALLHLQSTFEFDNFHPNAERVYRILTDEVVKGGQTQRYASSPYLLADNLAQQYACVEKATKVVRDFGWELNNPFKSLKVNSLYVEPAFFEIFGFSLSKGSIPTQPNSLAISHEAAEKFFGDTEAVGQVLTHPTYGDMLVTGVLKPYKKQTQFRSDVMVSMATYEKFHPQAKKPTAWAEYTAHTFVRLRPQATPQALQAAIRGVAAQSNAYLSGPNKSNEFRWQALNDISPSFEELRNNPYVDSMQDIYFNFSIPLMILLLAGFNYTNLTLAKSLSRSKEVGVRKVMGAIRGQLLLQFICEAMLIAFLALGIGTVILYLMKQFIHVQWVTWEVDNSAMVWALFVVFTALLGLVAGLLPASILSKFQPVQVLKGTLSPATFGKIGFRKVLVVIQFVVTLGFVFQIGHLYNQFNYMATENQNFNRQNIFNLSLTDSKYQLLVHDLLKNKHVAQVGLTSMPFGSMATECAIKAKPNAQNTSTFYYAADAAFVENMNLHLVAGRNLPKIHTDSASRFVLLNETALQRLNLGTPQAAIGQAIFLNNTTPLQVVGVVKDFCHFNYQFKKEPVVFQYNPAQFALLSVKVHEHTPRPEFVADMKALWKKHHPHQELGYSWYDTELYERYYPAEDMKMMGMASLVILVIAVMGLLGMVTYSTEKRYKEIGIRKVMGASVVEIVRLLSWSFLKLLLIAGLVALPIGYLAGYFLTSVFTYHPGINVGLMILFLGIVLLIAVVTIAYYTTRAALMNPVKSLKTD